LPTPPQARRWATDQQHHQQQHQQQEYEQQQQQQQHQPQQWRQQQHQQQLHSGLQDEDISSDSIERFRGLLNRIDNMREGLAKEIQDLTAWQSRCRVELIEVQKQVELLRVHNEMMSEFVTMQKNRAVADAKMHGEMRAEAAADAKMRAELLTEIQDLRAEMHRAKFNPASLVTELSDLRADVTRLTIPRVYADTAVPPPDIVTEAVRSASGSTEFDIVDTMPDESV
jgi:chromosome segregation ATPase